MSEIKVKIDAEYIKRKSKSIFRGMVDVLIFNMKSIVTKKSFYIMSSVFFAMVLTSIVVFVPYSWGASLLFIAYLVLPCLIILGWTGYNITNSTIMRNMKGTGQRKLTFYLGQILTIFIIGNVLSIVFWPIVFIFGKLGFFVKIWSDKASQINAGASNNIINPLRNMSWLLIIYVVQINILISFVVYQVIQIWVNSPKTYYMFVISIVILSIIFGGVINEYFYVPPGFGGNIEYGMSFLGEKGKDFDINENGDIIILDPAFIEVCKNQWWDANTLKPARGIFPDWMFIPSLLFPYYGIGEFASTAVGLNSTWTQTSAATQILYAGSDISSQLSIYMQPLHFWSWFAINPFANEGWKWWLVLLQPYITIFVYLCFTTASEIAKEML